MTGSGHAGQAAGTPRRVRRSQSRSASEVKLPSDLDIFSPSTSTQPLWTQCLANGLPIGDRLGALVLVMRERQVAASAVEIEPVAEKSERHDDTFGVPSGASLAERRVAKTARLAWRSSRGRSRRASASARPPPPVRRLAVTTGSGPRASRILRPCPPPGRRHRRSRRQSPGRRVAI